MRRPATAKIAGSSVSDASIARATTIEPGDTQRPQRVEREHG